MTVLVGDCRWYLHRMAGPVDAIVTDPPYELGFMGKAWDRRGLAFDPATWAACYAVLKPGGRLLAFGAPRTHHRIWTAIEDAGFTIEDTVMWIFGQGFPKHKSKLKPAFEPVCVARKGSVTALNIDAARIGYVNATDQALAIPQGRATSNAKHAGAEPDAGRNMHRTDFKADNTKGRWPANVVLDEDAAAALDAQSGTLTSGVAVRHRSGGNTFGTDKPKPRMADMTYADSGGASRFFYCAKASRTERERGLEGMPLTPGGSTAKGFTVDVANGVDRNRPVGNPHPTVKPLALMRWLVRLVTEPGDVVMDPFMGSGTTGMACKAEGRRFVGIELDPEYAEIARRRIAATEHDGQQALPLEAS